MNTKCEYDEKLIEFLGGELPAREAAQVEDHLRLCEKCREAAREFRISIAAVKAFLEAEGKASEGPSLAPSIMSRIQSEGSHFGEKYLAMAFAAVLALIFLFISDISPVKSPKIEIGGSASLTQSTGLVVQIKADRLDIEDRVAGFTRKVIVRP